MRRVIIFDFDGTIADTIATLFEVYNSIAPTYRCTPVDPSEINGLRNGVFMRKFMTDHDITSWKMPFVLRSIRKGMLSKMTDVKPYPGVIEILRELKGRGFELGIISSNTKENIDVFLKTNGMDDIFAFVVYHRNLFGKHVALNRLLKERKMVPEELTYVGDEERDIMAAKKSGAKSVAVTWGYQTHPGLEKTEPDHIVDRPEELGPIFS